MPSELNIGSLISFEVFSQDNLGIEKPDPRIFEIAFHEAGCEPCELLHVGDSLESDVAGAKSRRVEGYMAEPELGCEGWRH